MLAAAMVRGEYTLIIGMFPPDRANKNRIICGCRVREWPVNREGYPYNVGTC